MGGAASDLKFSKGKVGVWCVEGWITASQMAESRSPKVSPLSKTKVWHNCKSPGCAGGEDGFLISSVCCVKGDAQSARKPQTRGGWKQFLLNAVLEMEYKWGPEWVLCITTWFCKRQARRLEE